MLFLSITSYAYDIAVENADGKTIYYNYINDGQELEVTDGNAPYSGTVNIPETVTFMNRTRKVTSIRSFTFYYSRDITSITIPSSVTFIGNSSFEKCSKLTSVHISDVAAWCKIIFEEPYTSNPLVQAHHLYLNGEEIKDLVIPSGVTSINAGTFYGCSELTSVTIPEGVTVIGESAFCECRNIVSISFPSSVKSIGKYAFNFLDRLTSVHITDIAAWCDIDFVGYWYWSNPLYYAHHLYLNGTEVTDLVIPEGVSSIGNFAFGGCSGLTSVTIPSSVTSIGVYSFEGCDIPIVVSLIENPFEISSETFTQNTFKNATLYVPKGTIEKYKATSGWKEFMFISDAKRYKLTYFVDNEIYKSYEIEEGSIINPEVDPTKEGYTFSGWSEIPEIMPAHDVTVTGSFNINTYTLTYMIDGEEYKSYKVEYGASIIPEPQPEGEYATFEWVGVPETMPAHDVIVTAVYTIIPKEKCAKPIISYANGKLSFTSDTEGVLFISDITDTDIKRNYDSEISLTATYNISVYATKDGYNNSDVATATLCWIDAEPFAEGTKEAEDAVTEVKALPVLIQVNDGMANISSVPEGALISIYDTSGCLLGASTAVNGTTKIKIASTDKIVIVKIGDKTIKVRI